MHCFALFCARLREEPAAGSMDASNAQKAWLVNRTAAVTVIVIVNHILHPHANLPLFVDCSCEGCIRGK
jgi:ABC-type uncharacterized transport system ATPase subunit